MAKDSKARDAEWTKAVEAQAAEDEWREAAKAAAEDANDTVKAAAAEAKAQAYALKKADRAADCVDLLLRLELDVAGGYDERRQLLIADADRTADAGAMALARALPHERYRPCHWWYAPDVGLDRERHPWDPSDLVAQLRAAAALVAP